MSKQAPQLWQYFGLNVGNDINFNGANFDTDIIQDDASYLVSLGIKYFRVGVANYDNQNGITQERYVAQTYLDKGVNVQYGVNCGGVGADVEDRASFEAVLATEAAWAESVGVQRFQIGNELALSIGGGLSESQVYTYHQTLPSIVTGAGFTGIITTSESQDYLGQWYLNGKGNYDDIGADVYGSESSTYGINNISAFKEEIQSGVTALGEDFYISEWANDYGPGKDLNLIDPELYARHMMYRLSYLKDNFSRPCYLHCWRFNGTNTLDYSAAKKDDGTVRMFWYDVTGQRRSIYQ